MAASSFTFPSYDGTKENCRFGGWACGLQIYQPGQQVQLTGDITVKAIWNAAQDDEGSGTDDVKDFVEKNYLYIIVLIIVLLLVVMYLRSRRRY